MKPAARVYQFKVVLRDVTPPVWRTIQVPESYTFWDLHVAIQDAMGWLDYHLHVFRATASGARGSVQIGIPDDDAFEGDEPTLPGWEIAIAPYFPTPGTVVRYEYDFGDDWEHDVALEAITPRQPGARYPRCLAGERACPPEDCGGPPGYERVLAILSDPDHEDYEDTLVWLGGGFDPERFDPTRVTFDDPRKRWTLAFDRPAPPARRRAAHRGGRARGSANRSRDASAVEPDTSATNARGRGHDRAPAPARVGPRVYIAGPLFSETERSVNTRVAAALLASGLAVYLPQRDAPPASGVGYAARVFAANVAALEAADLVVAMCDGVQVDDGTAWEIGYAHARGIPVVGYRTDTRRVAAEERTNLMIEQSLVGLASSIDQLLAIVTETRAGRR
jgi:nucleoside 2-deoxyribosyltransferase